MSCDAILWRHGEAEDGSGTKVGGAPWGRTGRDADLGLGRFLLQLDFGDSGDLLPQVPAPVLQIFEDPGARYHLELPAHVRWRNREDLVAPIQSAVHSPLSGSLVRTWDDPFYGRRLDGAAVSDEQAEVALVEGVAKLGGVADDLQTAYPQDEVYKDGDVLLGQFESFGRRINDRKTYDRPCSDECNHVEDWSGYMFVFFETDGSVRVQVSLD